MSAIMLWLSNTYKMKNKKYHTVGTVPKYHTVEQFKNLEKQKYHTVGTIPKSNEKSLNDIQHHSLSWLKTGI